MQKLYTARDAMEAHFLKSLLEAEGIVAVVQGELLAVARGDLPLTAETLPSVWVPEEAAERALAIAATLKHVPTPTTAVAAWVCPRCGETVEGQFTACWNCGTERAPEGPA